MNSSIFPVLVQAAEAAYGLRAPELGAADLSFKWRLEKF
jgi:hypothetical protein